MTTDEKLDLILSEIGAIKSNVATMESDIGAIKSNVATMESDIGAIKSNVATMESDIGAIKSNVTTLEQEIKKTNLIIENEISPDIKILAENYVPAAKKYETEVETLKEVKSNIALLNHVVTEHSEKLKQIS